MVDKMMSDDDAFEDCQKETIKLALFVSVKNRVVNVKEVLYQ
jgi:hypothetical protein